MCYSYVKLSRNDFGILRLPISGLGLGNLLFPWARFMIATKEYRLRPIFPTWFQIRFGPILRGEKDKRFYHDLFCKPQGQIGGWRKLYLLSRLGRITEDEFLSNPQRFSFRKAIIVFEGERDYFRPLQGWDQFLYKEIRSMTDQRWLRRVDEMPDIPIGIHVRRGDFCDPKSMEDFKNKGALKTPLTWFIESLNLIRNVVNSSVQAFVVSDGTDGELRELLALKNIVRMTTGSAIGDLLALSTAKIFLSSGGSSFSAWASFLGQMPTISHPGQPLAWFNLINRKGYYIGEFNPSSPSPFFINSVRDSLQKKIKRHPI